jgi:uncharacterized protein YbjT (DUF2867 family)
VPGDLSEPASLEACLAGADAVFLLWPLHTAERLPAVLDLIARHARRVVFLGTGGALAMSLIHEADMAAVAVRALTEPGPEVLTQAEQVRVIGVVLGRPLCWQELTREQARQRLLADETLPDSFVDVLLDGYAAMLAGPPPVLTSTVEDVTGVPPRSLRQWAADHAGDFR